MAPGEELESERYLITIEERLHAPSDHKHEVRPKTQDKELKDSAEGYYQTGKRKRQVLSLTLCMVAALCFYCTVAKSRNFSCFIVPCLDLHPPEQ